MTFFSRYAASHRASFEPAISHAENASSRTCCMYRDRTEGLMQGGGAEGDPEIRTRLLRKERFPEGKREGPGAGFGCAGFGYARFGYARESGYSPFPDWPV